MTGDILSTFRKQVSVNLIPDGGGKFEISLDGDLVFSKLKEKRFPTEDEIKKAIRERI